MYGNKAYAYESGSIIISSEPEVHGIQWLYLDDDVVKWKHFPRYWSFVREIHWSPVATCLAPLDNQYQLIIVWNFNTTSFPPYCDMWLIIDHVGAGAECSRLTSLPCILVALFLVSSVNLFAVCPWYYFNNLRIKFALKTEATCVRFHELKSYKIKSKINDLHRLPLLSNVCHRCCR